MVEKTPITRLFRYREISSNFGGKTASAAAYPLPVIIKKKKHLVSNPAPIQSEASRTKQYSFVYSTLQTSFANHLRVTLVVFT